MTKWIIIIFIVSLSFSAYAQKTYEQGQLETIQRDITTLTSELKGINKTMTDDVLRNVAVLTEKTNNLQDRLDRLDSKLWALALGVIISIIGMLGNYFLGRKKSE